LRWGLAAAEEQVRRVPARVRVRVPGRAVEEAAAAAAGCYQRVARFAQLAS
jgi:hypothetical protein